MIFMRYLNYDLSKQIFSKQWGSVVIGFFSHTKAIRPH
jgi:hypothetical protein